VAAPLPQSAHQRSARRAASWRAVHDPRRARRRADQHHAAYQTGRWLHALEHPRRSSRRPRSRRPACTGTSSCWACNRIAGNLQAVDRRILHRTFAPPAIVFGPLVNSLDLSSAAEAHFFVAAARRSAPGSSNREPCPSRSKFRPEQSQQFLFDELSSGVGCGRPEEASQAC
jgi:hypothetical protein